MANRNSPNGFVPHGELLRSTIYVAGGTIYPGDLVEFKNDGTVITANAGPCIGAALEYVTSGADVHVADHPSQLFVAQADDDTIDTQTDLNLNASLAAGTPNTTYKISGMMIDASTINTTSTLGLRVLKVLPSPDNALGNYVRCIVAINVHQLSGDAGAVGN